MSSKDASRRSLPSRLKSSIVHILQGILRPLDLELVHISDNIRVLRDQEVLRATLTAQLRNTGIELADARRKLARIERQKAFREHAKRYINREALILLPRLLTCLSPSERFVIIDGGAREMEKDYRWRPFPPERLRFFGFEADTAEAARLMALPPPEGIERRFYPAALGGVSGKAIFEHNKATGGSSLLPQNRAVTDRWKFESPDRISMARDMFFPTHQEEIVVTTLNDWAVETGTNEIDFIKLNVQGGELDILKGGGAPFETTLGILVEVAFVESYRDRPMFSDLDKFLRDAGFTFFDLLAHHYIGRAQSPIAAQQLTLVEPNLSKQVSAGGQLIEGHALYLRDPIGTTRKELPASRILKLAAIAETFGQIEYAFELVAWLRERADVKDVEEANVLDRILKESSLEYESHRH